LNSFINSPKENKNQKVNSLGDTAKEIQEGIDNENIMIFCSDSEDTINKWVVVLNYFMSK
jgi:hypothetical protein